MLRNPGASFMLQTIIPNSEPHPTGDRWGVSIVIPCHNSASLLPRTLAHLARQSGTEIPWEVIIVDNASRDDTAQFALRCWPEACSVPLRVVHEPRLGVAYARERGITEARYELIGFVDDDNWVCPEWVSTAAKVMSEHPEAAAITSAIEAACEISPPPWFDRFKDWFAIGPDGCEARDATLEPGRTAGLILRKAAWQGLTDRGFHFLAVSRQGASFTGGEDDELVMALRLAGWRLWHEPRMRVQHFIPAQRLEWAHVRKRAWGCGQSTVCIDPYYFVLRDSLGGRTTLRSIAERLRPAWLWRALWVLKDLLRHPVTLLMLPFCALEGREEALTAEQALARFCQLLRVRAGYDTSVRRVRELRLNEASPEFPLP